VKVGECPESDRDRRRWSAACGLVLALAAGGVRAGDTPPAARPNIIVILADDFGYELVGANGGESHATPHLDRLAASGARFAHCYAQPLCTPTRVQLLTGLYNQRNYVRFAHLDAGARTFAQALRDAGYRTCAAGKWQLAGGPEAPRRFGFDEHLLWQLTVRKSRYANPVLERDGKVLDHPGAYGPDLIADFIIDFLRRHRDRPFLVYHPMLLTHAPFEPPPGSPGWDPRAAGGGEQGDPRHFPAMVAHADRVVGRIVAALEELGLRERTLVIFTGDNGSPRGMPARLAGREVRGGKGETTDAGTRVPLLVSWPGVIAPGTVRDDLVDSTDFLPAILDAARVPLPAGLVPDGRSFLPQLRGEPGNPRRWVYSWFSRDGGLPAVESARTRRFKLYGDGRFFDVAADAGEERDLGRGELASEAAAAREELAAVLRSFQGTRGKAAGVAAPAVDPEAAARRLEAAGATVFRKDGKVVEVILEGREVTAEMLRDAGALRDLVDLSLERTSTDDAGIELLAGLERLEWLNLYRTKVGDRALAALGRLPRLKHLPIGETGVTDAGLAHLEAMKGLEYLGLRGNRITDAGLAHVAKLAGLKGLHLGQTGVTDAGVARLRDLRGLEHLWLDGVPVTDAAVEPLKALRDLKELHVAGTRLSAAGLAALRAALPRCAVETEP
jgi:arylsulfatase A